MTVSEKVKATDNKIEQSKAQFDLDRQTGKILASSSGNVCKCEFLTDKDVLPEKVLLEKVATIKRLEYSPLGSVLKKQTEIAKNNSKVRQVV